MSTLNISGISVLCYIINHCLLFDTDIIQFKGIDCAEELRVK